MPLILISDGCKLIKVIGLGAGGHSRVVIEALLAGGEFDVVGLLDTNTELVGSTINDIPVLGQDEMLYSLKQSGICHAFIGLGGSSNNEPRKLLYYKAIEQGFSVVNSIHPLSIISPTVRLSNGVVILQGAIINANSKIGNNVIINTRTVVEHDCIIADHVHIATGAVLASSVTVGEGAHIGAGSVVLQGVSVGEGAVVGLGAAVIKDVRPGTTVVGVPAMDLPKTG